MNATRQIPIALAILTSLWGGLVEAQFTPPRVQYVINAVGTGRDAQAALAARRYYIDAGVTLSIKKGDVLNVYREKRPVPNMPAPIRMFIGTMVITEAQAASSVGRFDPADSALEHPMIRHKIAMVNDIVVPVLVIDNSVLFDPGQAILKPAAAGEFTKVADFYNLFTPGKLLIVGHTDSDGDADANLLLSEQRANAVKDWLVTTEGIPAAVLEAQGFGEDQPIVPNDTPENKVLNRRIEVQIWE